MLDGTSILQSLANIDSLQKEEDEEDISLELDFQEGVTYHGRDLEDLRKVPHSVAGYLQQRCRGKTSSLTSLWDSKGLNLICRPQTYCLL